MCRDHNWHDSPNEKDPKLYAIDRKSRSLFFSPVLLQLSFFVVRGDTCSDCFLFFFWVVDLLWLLLLFVVEVTSDFVPQGPRVSFADILRDFPFFWPWDGKRGKRKRATGFFTRLPSINWQERERGETKNAFPWEGSQLALDPFTFTRQNVQSMKKKKKWKNVNRDLWQGRVLDLRHQNDESHDIFLKDHCRRVRTQTYRWRSRPNNGDLGGFTRTFNQQVCSSKGYVSLEQCAQHATETRDWRRARCNSLLNRDKSRFRPRHLILHLSNKFITRQPLQRLHARTH